MTTVNEDQIPVVFAFKDDPVKIVWITRDGNIEDEQVVQYQPERK